MGRGARVALYVVVAACVRPSSVVDADALAPIAARASSPPHVIDVDVLAAPVVEGMVRPWGPRGNCPPWDYVQGCDRGPAVPAPNVVRHEL